MEKIKDLETYDLLEIVKAGKKVHLEKDDILIFELKDSPTDEAFERISSALNKHIPDAKCILLEGLEFKALLKNKES